MPKHSPASGSTNGKAPSGPARKRRRRWRGPLITLLILIACLTGIRLALPSIARWYVNRALQKSPLYKGEVGSIQIHLLRGGYTIRDLRIDKTTGNVAVPFFYSPRIDLTLQWNALFSGKLVGRIGINSPELNFVDAASPANSQTGHGGPWLEMIRGLFPFDINSAIIHSGSIHFRAFDSNPPVDVYLSHLEASITDLTNIHHDTAPLITTISASGLAMDQAKFAFKMKLDPFSYRPSFQLGVRLIGLDVTQINALAKAYGSFDFQSGFFDLVIELNAHEGQVDGYIKPLFRNLQVFNIVADARKDNPLQYFWEALVGATTQLFKNQNRNQFGTYIPISGTLSQPSPDILTAVGNVLRNAFIRAYLPRFQGAAPDLGGLEFGPGGKPPAYAPPDVFAP